MAAQIKLGDLSVDVVLKDIKNVHLSVHPPTGRVRISAPSRMSLETIRVFAVSKLQWIRKQQKRLQSQAREPEREYLDLESHYLWGRRYLLEVAENEGNPFVALRNRRMILGVRPNTRRSARDEVLANWYRERVKAEALRFVSRWQPLLGVQIRQIFVQQMKTRWGSYNPNAGTIRLNTELAKKSKDCLEYIVLHEMVHVLEPRHGKRFVALMDQFMPGWQARRQRLNELPVRHEEWSY
jgi:predicted metal-dependent hydrolase